MSVPAVGPELSDEVFLSFVTLMHQHWNLTGEVLSEQEAHSKYGITPVDYTTWINLDRVRTALSERGIVLDRLRLIEGGQVESFKHKVLTPEQLIVANIMLDLTDTRSNKKKLQDNGMTTAKWQSWLKDPVFQDYLKTRAEQILGDYGHEAKLALMDKVMQGDVKALEFYFEMTGQFTRASARSGAQTSNAELQNILIHIIEIISDEVDDPNVAARIVDRLKGLGQSRQIANDIIEGDIVKPEVMPTRELTPELQALMDRGAGHNG